MEKLRVSKKDLLKAGAIGTGGILLLAGCGQKEQPQSPEPPKPPKTHEKVITEERVDDFFDTYNNKYIDFDGAYGTQCVDLVQFYNKKVVGGSFLSGHGAADIWKTYPRDKYERVVNTPEGVPQKGDIVIWDRIPNNEKSFGHIAIFNEGNAHEFTVFAQTGQNSTYDKPATPAHFQYHKNYQRVLGWLHPKALK